jgi:DNA-binding transcriptional ArsR family regulator
MFLIRISREVKIMGDKLISVLKKNSQGLTITELVDKSKLSRSAVRIELAKLEGANKVSIRKIGMAKVYLLKGGENEK